ncbi:MAG TPA: SufS family cysteine desulfurase [Acidimicrobiales bacterium]|nr:SufS family cysteine desulfurase [Acidimicrobiales bacterium]
MAAIVRPAFDVGTIKSDFPLLDRIQAGRKIVFLDSAASSQRPRAVLRAMDDYYETTHANVHRGVYAIAEEATRRYEEARLLAGRLINAPDPAREIIFTKNVTEAYNLVAYAWGRKNLHDGDVIVLTETEHHANLVPWLMLKNERKITIRYIPIDDEYRLDLSNLEALVDGAKLVSVTAASNVLGTITDLRPIVQAAHRAGALVMADGAQLVPHRSVDVQALELDLFGYTGHKLLGPTGIGVLWARAEILEEMPPFLGGGEMISDVRLDGFSTTDIPWKFEAGTPPIAEAIGLGAAITYLENIGLDNIAAHERELTSYAIRSLQDHFEEIKILGPGADAELRGGVISFRFGDIHPHDVAQVLDEYAVCVRAGHHCAKPLMRRLEVNATTRASIYLYNDEQDIDALIAGLDGVRKMFT